MNSISRIGIIVAAAVMLLPSQAQAGKNKNLDKKGQVAIVAHRGFWNCEEAGYARNSIAALRCAQQQGFWGSEFDVNMTSDGELLVFHDSVINGKRIDQNPYSAFAGFTLENGEQIPTLDKFLTQAEESSTTVLVFELKKHSTPELENKAAEKSVELLKKHGLFDPSRVIFISFSMNACCKLASLAPGFTVQYLATDIDPVTIAEKYGIMGVDTNYKFVEKTPEWYPAARKKGMSVNIWTVNSEDHMKKMFEMGTDQLTTDEPLLARKTLQSIKYKEFRKKK